MISIHALSNAEVKNKNFKDGVYYLFVTEGFLIKDLASSLPFFVTAHDLNILIIQKNFTGAALTQFLYTTVFNNEAYSLMLIGLGALDNIKKGVLKENIRQGVGLVTREVRSHNFKNVIFVNTLLHDFFKHKDFFHTMTIAFRLASYEFTMFKSNQKKYVYSIYIPYEDDYKDAVVKGIEIGEIIAEAKNKTRLWSDFPSSDLYPEIFADQAEKFIEHNPLVSVKVFKKDELEKLGMGGIINVCRGSMYEPRMIVGEYKPENYTKTIALVGKGVTFDTGGISIKPGDNMEEMKHDMSGAAAVIGAFYAITKLHSPYRIIMCAPIVENTTSGNAFKPGDIVTFYNKKTAEIKNTDAEGRLILADALSYISEKYQPDIMLDLATLTGACSVALGPIFAAIMSKQEDLVAQVCKAGIETGERCWELPLDDAYKKAVDSHVADICNIGSREYRAGTITASWFLHHFVGKNIQWAHLDIAGVAYKPVGKKYLDSYNASGFGVEILTELCTNNNYLG